MMQGRQRRKLEDWCNQVPVLGFNCGKYDLNLIKEHFAELLATQQPKCRLPKKPTRRCSGKLPTSGF